MNVDPTDDDYLMMLILLLGDWEKKTKRNEKQQLQRPRQLKYLTNDESIGRKQILVLYMFFFLSFPSQKWEGIKRTNKEKENKMTRRKKKQFEKKK